jgi:hypothetical protein
VLSFQKVHIAVGTAPTGANIICDVNRGTGASEATIFSAGDRPTMVAGNKMGESTTFSTANLSEGHYLTFDIDQVGSIIAGNNLVFTVLLG